MLKSKYFSSVKLPIEVGIVPPSLLDPEMLSFMYVMLVRVPMSEGIKAPALYEIEPRPNVTGMPAMYPPLLQLNSPEPPVLPPYDVHIDAAAHAEYRGISQIPTTAAVVDAPTPGYPDAYLASWVTVGATVTCMME